MMKNFENKKTAIIRGRINAHSVSVLIDGYVFTATARVSDKNKYAISFTMKHENSSYTETILYHDIDLFPEEYETVLKHTADDTVPNEIDTYVARRVMTDILKAADNIAHDPYDTSELLALEWEPFVLSRIHMQMP